MKYYFFTLFVLTIFSAPSFAENEATFESSSGIVTIPQVIVLGDKEFSRFNVKMKLNENGDFTLVQLDKTSASIDTAVEKYITLDTKTIGRLVYGQMLKRVYSSNTDQLIISNSLPHYVTDYVQGVEVRLYHNNNDANLLKKTLTDSNGFYQLSVESVGSYKVCFGSTNDYCGTFTTSGAPSQRCDYNDLSGGIKPEVRCTSF